MTSSLLFSLLPALVNQFWVHPATLTPHEHGDYRSYDPVHMSGQLDLPGMKTSHH
jgi:hypothetical protein